MNRQLKNLTRVIFVLFLALFVSVTMIQAVSADSLRANALNQRSVKNSFEIERGPILVDGSPVALSKKSDSRYNFTREYPAGPEYAPITGYFSHYQGATGIESAMNAELSGAGNAQFWSRVNRIISGQDPQGSSIALTINPAAQKAAYDSLEGLSGAVVAIEPSTGKILALASSPSYDPNLLESDSDQTIIENYKKLDSDPASPLANRAIAGKTYHPGSTFKLVTVAAALDAGVATPDTEFPDPVKYRLPGTNSDMQNASRSHCEGGDDKVTLERALANSCNIPMAELAAKLGDDQLVKTAEGFGFNQGMEIPLKVTQSAAPATNDPAQKALSAIGQWDVRATPLQMAMVSAGIANGGKVMDPYLVDSVVTPDLRVEKEFSPKEFGQAVKPETAETLKKLMVTNVSSGIASQASIPGTQVAGKTGTAENGKDANGNNLPYTISFTGFAPASEPKIAVAVFIEDGGGPRYNYQAGSAELPTGIAKKVMEAVLQQ